MYVLRAETTAGAGRQPVRAEHAPADRLLGQDSGHDQERARAAAVVMQVGALAGQPTQRPHLVVGGASNQHSLETLLV